MGFEGRGGKAHSTRQLLSLAYFWSLLRMPESLTIALLTLALVLGLAFMIPQQPATVTSANEFTLWVAGLPKFYQEASEGFNRLGLFRILRTPWFWLPAAGLVLICLIALADYAPLVWPRFWARRPERATPQPHPFHRQLGRAIRAPSPTSAAESAASGLPLARLRANLAQAGYQVDPIDGKQGLVAAYAPRRWGGPAFVLGGLLLIAFGLVAQAWWGERQTVRLAVGSETVMMAANQPLRLKAFRPTLDEFNQIRGGKITLEAGQTKTLSWQLHRPSYLRGWWVIPVEIQPSAQIKLTQNQNSNETTRLTFADPLKPVEFLSPEQNLLFALRYLPGPDRPDYQLTLIGGPENLAELPPLLRAGANFSVPDFNLTGQVWLSEALLLQAYYLPTLGVVMAGLLLTGLGLVSLTLPPPRLIWLHIVTKGRGSRIEVVAEFLREMPPETGNLEQILVLPAWEETNG